MREEIHLTDVQYNALVYLAKYIGSRWFKIESVDSRPDEVISSFIVRGSHDEIIPWFDALKQLGKEADKYAGQAPVLTSEALALNDLYTRFALAVPRVIRNALATVTLDDILKRYFGCTNAFAKEKRPTAKWSDGSASYTYITEEGSEAYGKLTQLLYDLDNLGVIRDANSVVEELDQIVDGEV